MALFLGISVLMPGKAMAYTFGVKVINQSGQKIKVRAIRIHKAGAILTGCTDDNNIVISTGDYTLSPQCSAGFDKWKRSIELNFTCVANGYKRQLRFPRGTNNFSQETMRRRTEINTSSRLNLTTVGPLNMHGR
jgi:hypothetical protein